MKSVYTLKEDGFSAYWFEGSKHKEKAIIWMHGSAMNEKHCLADSLYLSEAGYSVLVLGFYYWKGMSKKMRAIPVEYVERAASELKKNGYEKIGIHGISSGAAYALLCASLIPDISLALGICPFDYVVEEPKIIGKPTGRSRFCCFPAQAVPGKSPWTPINTFSITPPASSRHMPTPSSSRWSARSSPC